MSKVNGLDDANNITSWTSDEIGSIWAEYVYNQLEEKFEVIILSGQPEQSNAPNSGETIGTEFGVKNDNRYYFVRVRPLKTAAMVIPSPFNTKNIQEAKKIINMHPMAYIAVNETIHPPAHGDIFLCRYTRKDRLGLSLIKRMRSSGKTITTLENKRTMATLHNTQQPQRLAETPKEQPSPGPSPAPRGPMADNTSHTVDSNRFFIFGDSQAQNSAMGQTLKEYIKEKNPKATVNSVSNQTYVYQGRPVKYYANLSPMDNFYFFIRKRKPQTIYIFLGGNPSGGDPQTDYDNTKKLIKNLRQYSKHSNIIWIGPPPPANHSLYRSEAIPAYTGPYEEVPWTEVKTKSSTFYRGDYIHRKAKSDAIKQAISEIGDAKLQYIDLYGLPLFQRIDNGGLWGEPYGNPQFTQDGIHVKGQMRTQALQEAKIIK